MGGKGGAEVKQGRGEWERLVILIHIKRRERGKEKAGDGRKEGRKRGIKLEGKGKRGEVKDGIKRRGRKEGGGDRREGSSKRKEREKGKGRIYFSRKKGREG